MNKLIYLLAAVALIACSESENIADVDFVAQGGSSSSVEELSSDRVFDENAPASSSSATETASENAPVSGAFESLSASSSSATIANSSSSAGGNSGNQNYGGGCAWDGASNWSRYARNNFPFDTTEIVRDPPSLITLDSVLEGRIKKLTESGNTQEQATAMAKSELFTALGFDSVLRAKQDTSTESINHALDDIFGGTTKSEFYKDVKNYFTENGALQPKHYCNFVGLNYFRDKRIEGISIYGEHSDFPDYALYDNSAYESVGCAMGPGRPIPREIVNETKRKCMNLPVCDNSIRDTIIWSKTIFGEMDLSPFICREKGWDAPTRMEIETYGIPCDREGKYVVYSKRADSLFVCSLDSGWHKVETIDAETFDVPCDKHGKLFESPNRPNVTYVCRTESFCRHYDVYTNNAPCFDKGWDYAQQKDFETSKAECDSEGITYQSPNDPNLYYVCHDEKWTEFFNMPCDTDNKRVKIINEKVYTKFTEYICYNKTWRPTYEWHTDYPTEYYFNPDIEYGRLEDPRDHHVYRTVVFKGKTWMAENMKYEGPFVADFAKPTACLEDDCKNVGRFYSFDVAGEVCPDGWRLPDSSDVKDLGYNPADFMKLYSQLGGTGSSYSAPDTYGMSFILSGRIPGGVDPYELAWQGYATFLWMNPTRDGNRLALNLGTGKAEMFWYSTIQVGADVKKDDRLASLLSSRTYMSVRCIKK